MALAYKVLAQSAPGATTDTTLYTAGAGVQTVVSSIVICNRSASSATYRIAIRPNAETLANKHYIAFDRTIAGNATETHVLGITVDAADVITVRASVADLSFNAYGVEIS